MKDESMLQAAKDAVVLAKKLGANDVAASASRSRQVDLNWRDGKPEKVTEATSRQLSLALYVDGRYSAVSTSDLRPDALSRFVEESIAMTRTLAKDPFRTLPEPALYAGRSTADLRLVDGKYTTVDAAFRAARAKELEESARSVKNAARILSISSSFGDSHDTSARVTSNGFEGEESSTSFSMGVSVSVKDDDGRRPEEGDYAHVRQVEDLPATADLGRRGAERAIARLGAKKTESAVLPMIIEARAAGRFARYILGPLMGASLQQKRSFFDGKQGTQVAGKVLTLTDDPTLEKGLGSRHFDGEGISSRPMSIFKGGVLETFYIDTYYGKKMKVAPTTGRPSNLVFALGTKSLAQLVAGMKDGFLVTNFLGGNSNDTTGDFSLGVAGYRIRGGQKAEAVGEMNIAGNHLAVWKQLVEVGNDPYAYSSARTPTLVFDGIQFAGK